MERLQRWKIYPRGETFRGAPRESSETTLGTHRQASAIVTVYSYLRWQLHSWEKIVSRLIDLRSTMVRYSRWCLSFDPTTCIDLVFFYLEKNISSVDLDVPQPTFCQLSLLWVYSTVCLHFDACELSWGGHSSWPSQYYWRSRAERRCQPSASQFVGPVKWGKTATHRARWFAASGYLTPKF